MTELIFWTTLLLLVYVYLGYPALAGLRARLRPRPPHIAPIEPTVSIIVVAHNEAGRIAARIENLLALDYPRKRLEIVVGSDGSTDATVGIARNYAAYGIRVCAFTERRGKAAVINDVVPQVRGEIVVFADARQQFEAGSVRALVENFADPSVGAVSGELMLATSRDTAAAARGAAFYWRYEKFIRAAEARTDSTVGATGAIYAIRAALFEPIPDDTILDDVVIPVRIARQGYRVLFEPRARAFDVASPTGRHEFMRKARTNAGTFQLFARERWLLNPRRNRLWFETVSHKGMRLMLPLLHASVLAANAALAWPSGVGFWELMLAGQVAFYAAAVTGYLLGQSRRPHQRTGAPAHLPFVFSAPSAICLLSWAAAVGFARFLTNSQRATWETATSAASVGPGSFRPAAARRSDAVPTKPAAA
jgi:GT2 family glycosyltransferase